MTRLQYNLRIRKFSFYNRKSPCIPLEINQFMWLILFINLPNALDVNLMPAGRKHRSQASHAYRPISHARLKNLSYMYYCLQPY